MANFGSWQTDLKDVEHGVAIDIHQIVAERPAVIAEELQSGGVLNRVQVGLELVGHRAWMRGQHVRSSGFAGNQRLHRRSGIHGGRSGLKARESRHILAVGGEKGKWGWRS